MTKEQELELKISETNSIISSKNNEISKLSKGLEEVKTRIKNYKVGDMESKK